MIIPRASEWCIIPYLTNTENMGISTSSMCHRSSRFPPRPVHAWNWTDFEEHIQTDLSSPPTQSKEYFRYQSFCSQILCTSLIWLSINPMQMETTCLLEIVSLQPTLVTAPEEQWVHPCRGPLQPEPLRLYRHLLFHLTTQTLRDWCVPCRTADTFRLA